MEFKSRFRNWSQVQTVVEVERQRAAFLNDPSRIPQNPPGLFTPTRCKVLKSFCVSGKPVQPGETVSLPWHVAQDMKSLGKAEIIE